MEDFLNNRERNDRVNYIISSMSNTNMNRSNVCFGANCNKNNHSYNVYNCDRNYTYSSATYNYNNNCSTGSSTPY